MYSLKFKYIQNQQVHFVQVTCAIYAHYIVTELSWLTGLGFYVILKNNVGYFMNMNFIGGPKKGKPPNLWSIWELALIFNLWIYPTPRIDKEKVHFGVYLAL